MNARMNGFCRRIKMTCHRLLSERAGNIAMTFVLVSVPLLGAIGVSVDYAQLVNSQRRLQDAIDSAAVAAAASLVAGGHTDTTAKDYAVNFVLGQMASSLTNTEAVELKSKLAVAVSATGSGSVKSYAVKVSGQYTVQLSPFANLIGYGTMPVGGVSNTQSQSVTKNAISMYVVLDRSGSMSFVTDTLEANNSTCQNYNSSNWGYYPNLPKSKPCYINKMAALKTAAAGFFDELDALEKKDKSDTVVRVGGVSFHDDMQTPQAIDWGTTKMRKYVKDLPDYPTGGTDMTDGMEEAYETLETGAEENEHEKKGNTSFSKFIVLMSDGENTGASSIHKPALDVITLLHCTNARKAGITIYTVAFMAPPKGEALLKACAGVSSNYYAAKDMESLVEAFAEIGNKATAQATRILN